MPKARMCSGDNLRLEEALAACQSVSTSVDTQLSEIEQEEQEVERRRLIGSGVPAAEVEGLLSDLSSPLMSSIHRRAMESHLAKLRKLLEVEIGADKTSVLFDYTYKEFDLERRYRVLVSIYKLTFLEESSEFLTRLSKEEIVQLGSIINTLLYAREDLSPEEMEQVRSRGMALYAKETASSSEKVQSKLLEAIGLDPSAQGGEMLSSLFGVLKDKLGFKGDDKAQASSERIFLDAVQGPLGAYMTFFAACVAGYSGIAAALFPMFMIYKVCTGLKSLVAADPEGSTIHSPLGRLSPRVSTSFVEGLESPSRSSPSHTAKVTRGREAERREEPSSSSSDDEEGSSSGKSKKSRSF